ncbi:radical SAM peptide maturase [Bacteroidia bacterium]|nr:radical SAM peptide maturase [Bacteroidia bacterium]GHV44325.1 radical SAM peptide maturase [Bacteroidia bacterium]
MKLHLTPAHIKYQLANLKQLTFEVTDACNLNCKYCAYGEFYNDYDKRENNYLSVNKAITLLKYLAEFWNSKQNISADRNVYISFYGGEPLLNMPFIEKIIDFVEKMNCKTRHFTFAMTTNAILLHKYIDFLVEKNFNLLVSLDGNEQNTSYRVDKAGLPAFEKIEKNIELLKVKYSDYFENKVNFNAVLHNRNSVAEIYGFFKKKYNKIPTVGELNDMGIRPDKQQLFIETYRNSYESLHQAENYTAIEKDMFVKSGTYQSVCTYLHQYTDFVYRDYNELLYGKFQKTVPTGTCMPFGKKMFVTVNGKLLPCERIGQQFSLGTVTDEKVELDFEKIAEKYNCYFSKLENQCQHCYNQKACVQCIFNLENLDENPVCYGFMNEKSFAEYEANQLQFLQKNPEEYYRIMEEVIVE